MKDREFEIICRWIARRSGRKEIALFSPRLVLTAAAVAVLIAVNPFTLEAYFSAHEQLFHALFTRGELPVPERFVGPLPEDSIPPRSGRGRPPNLIFILVDDQGYYDVAACGATDLVTPAMDKLFSDGMKFDNFYANCPVCSPTRASLITGLYPDKAGVPGVVRTHASNSWGFLDPGLYI